MKKPNNTTAQNTEKKERNYTKIEKFEILRTHMFQNGGVTADIKINDIAIYGVRVVECEKGDFLSFPQRKGSDGKYYAIVYVCLSPDDQSAMLAAIEAALNA